MKIKTKTLSYEEVMALPRSRHRKPMRPWFLLQLVVRILAVLDLFPTKFTYKTHSMASPDRQRQKGSPPLAGGRLRYCRDKMPRYRRCKRGCVR